MPFAAFNKFKLPHYLATRLRIAAREAGIPATIMLVLILTRALEQR